MSTNGTRRSEESRTTVLDAAERAFAEHGFKATSLEEIGRGAGLSRGAPGYLFGSKRRLYAAVIARVLARAQATLVVAIERDRDSGLPLPELLEKLVAAHIAVLAAEPALVRLIQWDLLEGKGEILGAIGAHGEAFVELFQHLGARGGHRKLDDTAATELVTSVAAMCWFPLAYADALGQAFRGDPRSPASVAARTKTIVDFVLTRLEAGNSVRAA